MLTRTSAGSTRTTPTRGGGTTRTASRNCPAPRPPTSMVASNASAPYARASRGPRTYTVTCVGDVTAGSPLRTRTGTAAIAHSTEAAATPTVTRAVRGDCRRTSGSETPMLTDSVTGPDVPSTEIGSVIASVSRATALAGPTTSTVAGSAVTVPTT